MIPMREGVAIEDILLKNLQTLETASGQRNTSTRIFTTSYTITTKGLEIIIKVERISMRMGLRWNSYR